MLAVLSQILLALITGSASIPVKIALVPYTVNVTSNGKAALPGITSALQLAQAIIAFMATGLASDNIRIGADTYTLTLVKS
jgi:hypothetical protein